MHQPMANSPSQPPTNKTTRFSLVPPSSIDQDVLLVSTHAFLCSNNDALATTPATIDNCKPVDPAAICHKIECNNDQTSILLAKTSPAIKSNSTDKILHATTMMASILTIMTTMPTTQPMPLTTLPINDPSITAMIDHIIQTIDCIEAKALPPIL